MTDNREWADTASYLAHVDEESLDGAFWLAFGGIAAVIGLIATATLFLLLTAACFWTWAIEFMLSGWGISLSALAVVSMLAAVLLLDRAQEARK